MPKEEEMREPLRTLLLMGCNHAGTTDPDEVLPYFEESLTYAEAQIAEEFLQWCYDNNRKFGHGNIDRVFEAWMETRTINV